MLEMSIGEYLSFAFDIIDKNEFQRRKVIKAKVREILKEDLLRGCLMPSIVLATYGKTVKQFAYDQIPERAKDIIETSIQLREVLIIDGLQRTYVMLSLKEELENKGDQNALISFLNQPLRTEVYVGIKRIGLLYRMITLNTGQTTMSTRHLMEILYHDYVDTDFENVRLLTDKDGQAPPNDTKHFSFKDILDGFNSLIEKDEGIINRTEILDNIKSLDILKDEVATDKDLFKDFIVAYKLFLDILIQKSDNWQLNKAYFEAAGFELKANIFGSNVLEIFKKSQALTGFGAALGQLKDLRRLTFEETNYIIPEINSGGADWGSSLSTMIAHIDIINSKSKKIGNDQRYYFRVFFRNLLNKESETYLNFSSSADYASNRTREERL